jgi:hypothetical protein
MARVAFRRWSQDQRILAPLYCPEAFSAALTAAPKTLFGQTTLAFRSNDLKYKPVRAHLPPGRPPVGPNQHAGSRQREFLMEKRRD